MGNKMIQSSDGNFHKGFYESCKENNMAQLLNIRSNNPAEISKTGECFYYYAENFLHSICHIFAYVLHQKFGYDILELQDESGCMVHWCCVSDYKGRELYIDVRGATTDYYEFLSEFQPSIGKNPLKRKINEKDLVDYADEWIEEGQIRFANEIIEKYYNYYSY